jgi:hypothetical protein
MMPSVLERKKNNAKSPSDANAQGNMIMIINGAHWREDLRCAALIAAIERTAFPTHPAALHVRCVQHNVKRSFNLR